jgi:hypothetical protein
MDMRILYPSDPLIPAQAEDFYEEERAAAQRAGLATALFSLEELCCIAVGCCELKNTND